MRFFTSFSLIFLVANQADALWPFTASPRSSTGPTETSTQATPVPSPYFDPSFDYRHAPSGFFEFPQFTTFLKPVAYQQQPIQQQQVVDDVVEQQQVDPNPVLDSSGVKGGGGQNPGVKGSFFGKFWRYQRKPSSGKPGGVATQASESSPVSTQGVDGSQGVQDPFGNSDFMETIPDPKHPGRAVPWNWVFWNQQQQQQPQVVEMPPAHHSVEAVSTSNEPQVQASQPPRRVFSLPNFPNFQGFHGFPNLFPNKPKPMPVQAPPSPQQASPGEHCQCWQTGQPQPQFGFPIPFPGGYAAPGVVASEPYPGNMYENQQQFVSSSQQQQQQQQQSSDNNVKVVVSGPDHQYLDSVPIGSKVIFSSEGSVNEPIAAESSPEASMVVAPPPSQVQAETTPTPVVQSVASSSPQPAKTAATFSGVAAGGTTTPQEQKVGKQFSIGKSKFSASVAAKGNKH